MGINNNVIIEKNTVNGCDNLQRWMSFIPDKESLIGISIPGTHDSGALREPVPNPFWKSVQCQNLSIYEQLEAGIRYLDIRCRHIDDSFSIYHGCVDQELSFDDVLSACYSFLEDNQEETIIMSIKEEYKPSNITCTFEETFDSYVQKNPLKWHLDNTIPNIGDVRGKIVLLRRFYAENLPKGIDANPALWKDDDTFIIQNEFAILKIQDNYKVSNNDKKWGQIQSVFDEARSMKYSDYLYINYTSGYQTLLMIPDITKVSDNINPRIEGYFSEIKIKGRFGIVVMDYVDCTRSNLIIQTNFI